MIIGDLIAVFDNPKLDSSLLTASCEKILASREISGARARFSEFAATKGLPQLEGLSDLFAALILADALCLAVIEKLKMSGHSGGQGERHKAVDIWGEVLAAKAAFSELMIFGGEMAKSNAAALEARTQAVADLVQRSAWLLSQGAAPYFGLSSIAGLIDAVRELAAKASPPEKVSRSLRYISDL